MIEDGDGWRAELADRVSLRLEPVSAEVELDGVTARICRVTRRGRRHDGRLPRHVLDHRRSPRAGRSSRPCAASPPSSTRATACSRSPGGRATPPATATRRCARALFIDGELHQVEEARISTVYDGGGRQRSAGLELWLPGEEFPRRGSGQVIAGSSFELETIQVHAAVFRWRLDGREGIGAYELMVRVVPPVAA